MLALWGALGGNKMQDPMQELWVGNRLLRWGLLEMQAMYSQDGVEFWHGDCAEILPLLPRVDLIVTSPPYGGIRAFGGHTWDFKRVAPAIAGSLAEGAVLCWQTNDQVLGGGYTGESFECCLWFMREGGLLLHQVLITHKRDGLGSVVTNRFHPNFDYVFVLSRGLPKTFNALNDRANVSAGGKRQRGVSWKGADGSRKAKREGHYITPAYGKRTAVWDITIGEQMHDEAEHPAKMPFSLATDLIKAYSNPGDLVCDPFSGSGTTARAAQLLGRKAVGIEIHRPYIDEGIRARFSQGLLLPLE